MNLAQCRVSSCSRCRFYAPEGRRGGQCSQLGVPVESRWSACSLAVPVFSASMVEMQPLDFLSQPVELTFSEVLREPAWLEETLDAPSVLEPAKTSAYPTSAPAPVHR